MSERRHQWKMFPEEAMGTFFSIADEKCFMGLTGREDEHWAPPPRKYRTEAEKVKKIAKDLPSEQALCNMWKEVVEGTKYECLFRRGQWLILKFVGVERRNRHRVAVHIAAARSCDIRDAEQMMRLWSGGL